MWSSSEPQPSAAGRKVVGGGASLASARAGASGAVSAFAGASSLAAAFAAAAKECVCWTTAPRSLVGEKYSTLLSSSKPLPMALKSCPSSGVALASPAPATESGGTGEGGSESRWTRILPFVTMTPGPAAPPAGAPGWLPVCMMSSSSLSRPSKSLPPSGAKPSLLCSVSGGDSGRCAPAYVGTAKSRSSSDEASPPLDGASPPLRWLVSRSSRSSPAGDSGRSGPRPPGPGLPLMRL
mmetsp:Transcript_20753/g.73858  ORF Transcript_20753/g.73858 Transcript_20753/m.73858 type:complete len:238 (-) Transcript_20753:546-1259(-)